MATRKRMVKCAPNAKCPSEGVTFTFDGWDAKVDVLVYPTSNARKRGWWFVKAVHRTTCTRTGVKGAFGCVDQHSRAPKSLKEAARWAIMAAIRHIAHEMAERIVVKGEHLEDGGPVLGDPHAKGTRVPKVEVRW